MAAILAGALAEPRPAAAEPFAPSDASPPTPRAAAGSDSIPARVSRQGSATDWLRLGVGAVTVASLDPAFRQVALRARGSAADEVARVAKWPGDWRKSVPIFAAGALGIGTLADGTEGLRGGGAALLGVAAGAMANETLNRVVGRRRPDEDRGAYAFDPFHGHASFPSGHTALAFSMAGAVDASFDGWEPAAAYGIAALCGLSRIYHDKHWVTDVVAGAVVGTLVGRWATRGARDLLGLDPVPGREHPGGAPGASAAGSGDAPGAGPRLDLLLMPYLAGLSLRF